MNLMKSYDFFNPNNNKTRIHIIGCGSVGSTVAENLARCGVTNMTLWDFDDVESHNVANQMFREKDVGRKKVEALLDILTEINPDIRDSVYIEPNGWNGEVLSGYLFLCVDNIDLRRDIVKKHLPNPYVQAVFDFRTSLESAQHYAADWNDRKQKTDLVNSMNFTHEEAVAETPVSACGNTLGVATTVRAVCALGVNNYINFVKGNGIKKFIMIDAFNFVLDSF